MATLTENVQRVVSALNDIKDAIIAKGVTPSGKCETFATAISNISTGTDVSDTTAVAGDVLSGKKFHLANGSSATGSMTNNGKVTPSGLNAGGSYTIPEGYHNGQGVVTANSLSSQTGVDSGKNAVTAGAMRSGYQGWVNGSKITGSMANASVSTPTSSETTTNTLSSGSRAKITSGTYVNSNIIIEAAAPSTETKTATPTTSDQTITPTSGKLLSSVTVKGVNVPAAANILSGSSVTSNNTTLVSGSMTNNGKVTPSGLNAGGSYTIPAGYHNGQGVVTANSLSSQTSATAAAADIASGKTAWVNGSKITGNHTDIDVSDTTAVAGDVLSGKTFHLANGTSTTGSMTNNGKVTQTLDTTTTSYTVPGGYHNGTGTVSLVTQEKEATLGTSVQTITPDSGKVLSSVLIPKLELPTASSLIQGAAVVVKGGTAPATALVSGSMQAGVLTGSWSNEKFIYKLDAPSGDTNAIHYYPKNVTSTETITTKSAQTITPTTSSQLVIASGTRAYFSGAISVNPIPPNYIITSDATATTSDIASGKTAYVNGSKITGNAPRIKAGVLSGAGSTAITITLGWKPKKLITWKCVSTTNNTPTSNIQVYDADASTSVYFYTNTSGAVATTAIPNSATNRLNSISDTGFTYKTAAGSTLYYYYIAIG